MPQPLALPKRCPPRSLPGVAAPNGDKPPQGCRPAGLLCGTNGRLLSDLLLSAAHPAPTCPRPRTIPTIQPSKRPSARPSPRLSPDAGRDDSLKIGTDYA